MKEKIRIGRVIVVEGKYDKIKLDSIVDGVIVTTDGFGVFKDREKQAFLRRVAEERGILTATDSDGAGLVIRGFLSSIIPKDKIAHLLIPPTVGKEPRKKSPSKEGTLGVEGIDPDILRRLLEPFAEENSAEPTDPVTVGDLYEDGFVGAQGSREKRKSLEKELSLPSNLSTASLIDALNMLGGREIYKKAVLSLNSLTRQ